MKVVKIYDPALCCATGVCGVETDQTLIRFAADVEWIRGKGGSVERYNLAQTPLAFVEHPVVRSFLERSGSDALPLVLVDDEIALAGRYPSRPELARWLGIEEGSSLRQVAKGCCSGDGCC
jgi:hypothetical protein